LFSVDDLNYTHLAPFVYTTRGMSILDHSIEETNDEGSPATSNKFALLKLSYK